jgi:protein-S-isoprenylcysteine O-methyltransferase Ste14
MDGPRCRIPSSEPAAVPRLRRAHHEAMMKRTLILLYGVACYAVFFATFLYAIGFIGNLWVPKGMDSPPTAPFATALLIDLGLLALFAVQHSVMARPAFKRAWTRLIPESAERSTYTLLSSVALILLFWLWSPLGGTVWDVQHPAARTALYTLFAAGWMLLLYTTFLLNHFDLFGLRQVWLQFRGRPYTPLPFRTPTVYRWVRHPLYVAWLLTFWATPTMTMTHLLFAVMTTVYILLAIRWEERDLVAALPEYEDYRRRVPMLLPGTRRAEKAPRSRSLA